MHFRCALVLSVLVLSSTPRLSFTSAGAGDTERTSCSEKVLLRALHETFRVRFGFETQTIAREDAEQLSSLLEAVGYLIEAQSISRTLVATVSAEAESASLSAFLTSGNVGLVRTLATAEGFGADAPTATGMRMLAELHMTPSISDSPEGRATSPRTIEAWIYLYTDGEIRFRYRVTESLGGIRDETLHYLTLGSDALPSIENMARRIEEGPRTEFASDEFRRTARGNVYIATLLPDIGDESFVFYADALDRWDPSRRRSFATVAQSPGSPSSALGRRLSAYLNDCLSLFSNRFETEEPR